MFFIKRAFHLLNLQKMLHLSMLCLAFFCGRLEAPLSAQEVKTGTGKEVAELCAPGGLTLYPDGRWSALHAGLGLGYVMHRDLGTAPIRFQGPAACTNFGLWYDRPRWSVHINLPVSIGAMEDAVAPILNFNAMDISVMPDVKVLYAPRQDGGRYRYLIGGSLTDRVHIAVHPDYENASVGVSNFVGINLIGRCERSVGRHRAHVEGSILPVALITRPGYSYIGNPTADNEVADTFVPSYQSLAKAFAALRTDMGFDFLLRNGNRIILSYVWQYSSSGDRDIYRFDHAMHLLNADFVFALRQKPVKK